MPNVTNVTYYTEKNKKWKKKLSANIQIGRFLKTFIDNFIYCFIIGALAVAVSIIAMTR